jgi:hypothetical protein
LNERESFLIGYTERLLGRELSEDEKSQFEGLRSRNEARALLKIFSESKPKTKAIPKKTPKKVIKDEE